MAASPHRRRLRRGCLCLLGLAAMAVPAAALAQSAQAEPTSTQHRDENGETLAREPVSVTWAITYNSDANANVSGGNETGGAYLQRIGLLADADLDSLLGWRGGSAHLSVHAIQGNGLSGLRVGNLLTVSGIEAAPALRLFNLWIEQKLGSRLAVRVGQFTAGQEFAISPTATLFVNSTFGWPGSFATDLPSGGPAYPLAAPGVRVALDAGRGTVVRAAVFSGDPAGQGSGDPQRRDLHGFNGVRLKGKPFVIGEIVRSSGGDDPSWSATLGGWVHFDRFDDLRFDGQGRSLSSPLSQGNPLRHARNYAFYFIVDHRLWRAAGRSVRGFVRLSASPADRNAIDLYVDGGLSISSSLRARPNDTFGIGVAIARTSPQLRSRVRDSATPGMNGQNLPGFEAVIEASYQIKATASLSLQPNVQLVLHPSGALLTGMDETWNLPRRAIAVGLRTSLRL